MSLVYTDQAEADLREAFAWLAERNPEAAWKLLTRLLAITDALDSGRLEGPEQRLRTGERVRSWPLRPYRLYYQRRGNAVFVLRFYHQSRRPITRRRRSRR